MLVTQTSVVLTVKTTIVNCPAIFHHVEMSDSAAVVCGPDEVEVDGACKGE